MITRQDIEHAFSAKVLFRLRPWGDETAKRNPNILEIKARLLRLIELKDRPLS